MFKSRKDSVHVFYYSKDGAFDQENESFNHRLWLETGDMKHLPTKAGFTPVRFTFRTLGSAAKAYVMDLIQRVGSGFGMNMAVALTLNKIEPFMDENGKEITVGRVMLNDFVRISDKVMSIIEEVDDGDLMIEMVEFVGRKSFGDPLSKRE